MKNLIKLFKEFNIKALFVSKTDNSAVQFFRYLFVGAIATVADWGALWLFHSKMSVNLYVSTFLAFTIGLTVNFLLSKYYVFSGTPSSTSGLIEGLIHLITGLIGLGLTEGIMYLLCDVFFVYYLISKAIATVIVFAWNFGSKKLILYRKRDRK
jgi:putative flippase GtrA